MINNIYDRISTKVVFPLNVLYIIKKTYIFIKFITFQYNTIHGWSIIGDVLCINLSLSIRYVKEIFWNRLVIKFYAFI